MGLFRRSASHADSIVSPTSVETPPTGSEDKHSAVHQETASMDHVSKWKHPKSGGGDVAQALFSSPEEVREPIDPAEERRVVRKIDMMILPYLAVCYAFFYIDKTTLSYAAIFGIREDLNLVGAEYSWLSSIFYFGFLAWALPTNFLLQRLPVGRYLGFNIFLWGAFLMLQAAAPNFAALAALRALAGAAEAVADPAFMLVTAMWYTRRQQPIRMGLWYTANGFGIALGGLLGPVTAKGLSQREKQIAVERMREDQTGVENKSFKSYQVYEALCDYKLYLFFLLGIVCNVPNGGISNFGTIIIKGFGFSTLVTTLMQVPYGFIIAIAILTCVYLNDYMARNGKQTRCYFILIFLLPNIAGSFGLRYLSEDNMAGRLVSILFNWVLQRLLLHDPLPHNRQYSRPYQKSPDKCRAVSRVLYGKYRRTLFFYLSSQAPRYELGIWSMIVSHLIEFCIIVLLRFLLARENKRRDVVQSMQEGGRA
ncbi:related to MFS allantoate transporter [Ramularia collo-cygni]|uniref:Related to MFS allantoate transporter n=1 Tax=Ramularia collo-cygni TaxID=112498 RepID=A0A2D3UYL4_9PEZI|nr:related to MFS allantoate transporter [Ramularia collo-cygni]CZT19465.1 related to MFS allantoate transporter [Ramularia collo-cygni]